MSVFVGEKDRQRKEKEVVNYQNRLTTNRNCFFKGKRERKKIKENKTYK